MVKIDNFDSQNGTGLAFHNDWQFIRGGTELIIFHNRLYYYQKGEAHAQYRLPFAESNLFAKCRLHLDYGVFSLGVRNNSWNVAVVTGTDGKLYHWINKVTPQGDVPVASITTIPLPGLIEMGLKINGNAIEYYWNDTLLLTYTNPDVVDTGNDIEIIASDFNGESYIKSFELSSIN